MARTIQIVIAGCLVAFGQVAWAQAEGEAKVDPIKELKKALEKMRSAEELLAQTARARAAVEQDKVDAILRKLLDEVEMKQTKAVQRMLKGAEKAAIGVSKHIKRVVDSAQFKQGKGGGQGMEVKQSPGKPRGEKPQDRDRLDRRRDEKAGKKPEQKQTGKNPGNQARDVYDAKGDDGSPAAGRETDPSAWYDQMPTKIQEDALKGAPASWPGRYERLIREWQKQLARLGSKK